MVLIELLLPHTKDGKITVRFSAVKHLDRVEQVLPVAWRDDAHVGAKLLLNVDDHLVRLPVVGHRYSNNSCQWEIAPQLISFQNVDPLLRNHQVPRVSKPILTVLNNLAARDENLVADVGLNLRRHIKHQLFLFVLFS